jgi:hypothetical protein
LLLGQNIDLGVFDGDVGIDVGVDLADVHFAGRNGVVVPF